MIVVSWFAANGLRCCLILSGVQCFEVIAYSSLLERLLASRALWLTQRLSVAMLGGLLLEERLFIVISVEQNIFLTLLIELLKFIEVRCQDMEAEKELGKKAK